MFEKHFRASLIMIKLLYRGDCFTRFNDYEDMLEETWHFDYPRRPDMVDSLYPGFNTGLPMWDSYLIFQTKPKKEEKVGLAKAITSSILSTGRSLPIS